MTTATPRSTAPLDPVTAEYDAIVLRFWALVNGLPRRDALAFITEYSAQPSLKKQWIIVKEWEGKSK